MDDCHTRPTGVDDATVAAVGKISEALETIERARGHLYSLHQLLGHADFQLEDGADMLEDAGHSALEPGNIHELVSATDRFGTRHGLRPTF